MGLVLWVKVSGQEALTMTPKALFCFPNLSQWHHLGHFAILFTEYTYLNQYRPDTTTYFGWA